jgi:excisionase family DNA binding protein
MASEFKYALKNMSAIQFGYFYQHIGCKNLLEIASCNLSLIAFDGLICAFFQTKSPVFAIKRICTRVNVMGTFLCSVNDAAKRLSVGRTFTYGLIKQGQLDIVKLGRRTLVKVESINALIERSAGDR